MGTTGQTVSSLVNWKSVAKALGALGATAAGFVAAQLGVDPQLILAIEVPLVTGLVYKLRNAVESL